MARRIPRYCQFRYDDGLHGLIVDKLDACDACPLLAECQYGANFELLQALDATRPDEPTRRGRR